MIRKLGDLGSALSRELPRCGRSGILIRFAPSWIAAPETISLGCLPQGATGGYRDPIYRSVSPVHGSYTVDQLIIWIYRRQYGLGWQSDTVPTPDVAASICETRIVAAVVARE